MENVTSYRKARAGEHHTTFPRNRSRDYSGLGVNGKDFWASQTCPETDKRGGH